MKQDYKAYLEMIADNVERLLATHKEDKRVATNNDPLTKHEVAEKLQGGMTRQLEMTHAEHGRILAQQYAFQAEAVEIVRREMVQYGMVLSNLAQETKRQRAEISSTAKHLLGYLDTRGPTNIKVENTNPTTDPSTNRTTDPATDANNIYIRHVKQSMSFVSWKAKF